MENVINNSYYEASIIDSLAVVYLKDDVFNLLISKKDSEDFIALR